MNKEVPSIEEVTALEISENNKRRKALENIFDFIKSECVEDEYEEDYHILESALDGLEELIHAFCHMYDNPFNNHAFKNRETKKYGKIIKRKRH